MNLFELCVKIGADVSEVSRGTEQAKTAVDKFSEKAKSTGEKIVGAFKTIGKGAAVAFGAIAAGAAVMEKIIASTEEYRVAMGKLNTAFSTAGYSAEKAKESYSGLYKIIGDTDTATEAAQLMAKLSESEADLAEWTNIAAGVAGTFGDALPINSLMEASNETAKVGQVTGVLADALNWAGISEDGFNAKLAECGTESMRNQLIMETLAATYDNAAASFYENNEEVVKARENQVKLQESTAVLGEKFQSLKNDFLEKLTPSFQKVMDAGLKFIDKVSSAFKNSRIVELLGTVLETAFSLLEPLGDLIVYFLPALEQSLKPVAEILALVADTANVIVGLLTLNGDKIKTALGLNMSSGQLSNTQRIKYGNALNSNVYDASRGGWVGSVGGYIEAGTGKFVSGNAGTTTNNYYNTYNTSIDANRVTQFNDVVRIAQNERIVSRMGVN